MTSDVEMFLSMNTKEPCSNQHDLKVVKKSVDPNTSFKFAYGE